MSRPIGEMRIALPQELGQVYAGDLAAARQLGGRAVHIGVPGEARAARVQQQQQIAEPPGLWKRFLNFIGLRSFTPAESYRAQTHALSKQLEDAVMQLSTGHASKDALLGRMQDITKSIRALALTVVGQDRGVQDLFADKARLGQENAALQARLAKASDDDAPQLRAEIDANTRKRSETQDRIDSTVAHGMYRVENDIVETRMKTLIGQLGDGALRQLRDVAEQTYQRFLSQVPNTDLQSPEWQALPEGPAKDIEYALRLRERKSLCQPMGLAQAAFVTASKELAARQWETSGAGAIDMQGYQADAKPLLEALAGRLAPAVEPRDHFQTTFQDTSRNMRFAINGEPLDICELGDRKADKTAAMAAYATDKDRIAAKFGEHAPQVLALLNQQLITQIANPLFKHATLEIGNPPEPFVMKGMNSGGRSGSLQASMNVIGGGDAVSFEVDIRRAVAEMEDATGRTHRFDPDASHLDVRYRIAITPDNHLILDGEPRLAYHLKSSGN